MNKLGHGCMLKGTLQRLKRLPSMNGVVDADKKALVQYSEEKAWLESRTKAKQSCIDNEK
ncbi:hypothetical protein L1D34_29650 [Vibrio mediterranei]|jgi:hypothetical protein|uniref:hypothetical protein n=1 Tax=Vibrio mediterranei TaxID=689 RepID=UPI001EFD6D6F|nr:hypothetical protein [Vibrio mediterranei]MCG9628975.1 hypothetical protein [Vibrio mediterranei]MCY9855139.1 hypothetical protein [Vibrio mediterranei]